MPCEVNKGGSRLNEYIGTYGQELGLTMYLEEKAFLKEIGATSGRIYSDKSRAMLYQKIAKYNNKYGHSNTVIFEQVSPTSWKINAIRINLKPVDIQAREERAEMRSEEGKVFTESVQDFTEQKESNLQEYNKVKKAETMEEVKAQMLKDFDSYYPQFKDLLSWEKEMFIDMMSEGEINTYC